jgi:hypothetical protein
MGWLRSVFKLAGLSPAWLQVSGQDFGENLIRYNSREEAIQAGKKPCAECRP